MQTIIAVDPSLTNTAVCVGDGTGSDFRISRFSSAPDGGTVCGRVARYDQLVSDIMEWINLGAADAVLLEGYSFGSKGGNPAYRAEFGGILRWHLTELTSVVYEVAPNTLKKFATGKGVGGKEPVIAHLTHRHGVVFNSSDEYDAFGLYRLGLCVLGLQPTENEAQAQAVSTVLGLPKQRNKKPAATTKGMF